MLMSESFQMIMMIILPYFTFCNYLLKNPFVLGKESWAFCRIDTWYIHLLLEMGYKQWRNLLNVIQGVSDRVKGKRKKNTATPTAPLLTGQPHVSFLLNCVWQLVKQRKSTWRFFSRESWGRGTVLGCLQTFPPLSLRSGRAYTGWITSCHHITGKSLFPSCHLYFIHSKDFPFYFVWYIVNIQDF